METLSYQDFIDGINKGKIIKAVFKVKDYARYRCCSIEVFPRCNSKIEIDLKLAKSYYIEEYGLICGHFVFYDKFDENRKLFNMGKNGTFNLKQIWNRIEFISIDYAT